MSLFEDASKVFNEYFEVGAEFKTAFFTDVLNTCCESNYKSNQVSGFLCKLNRSEAIEKVQERPVVLWKKIDNIDFNKPKKKVVRKEKVNLYSFQEIVKALNDLVKRRDNINKRLRKENTELKNNLNHEIEENKRLQKLIREEREKRINSDNVPNNCIVASM